MNHTDISHHIANGRRLRAEFIRRHPQTVYAAVSLVVIVVFAVSA
jgi:hypothetical protein